MPKLQKKALLVQNVKHPNSRKAARMMKHTNKQAYKEKKKVATYIKQNLVGEKLLWFKARLPSEVTECSKEMVKVLMESYLHRFNDELEQIKLKHSIGQRKNRQHASREDTIEFTQKRELEEFNACGIEMPNLLDAVQVKLLRDWNGELRYLQQFQLTRLGRQHLEVSLQDVTLDGNMKPSESSSTEELIPTQPTTVKESNEESCSDSDQSNNNVLSSDQSFSLTADADGAEMQIVE